MTLAPFLLAAFISAPSGDASGITWIHDDWGKAQRSALETGKLVAVDVWATWCHACLSMKTYVLTQKDLAAVKDKHVWLAVDYDKPANAEFFAKYPINSFPTFMVIDPRSGDLAGRWRGTGTAAEMAAFFATSPENPDDALLRGQRALARGDHQSAVDILKSAIDDTRNPTKRAKLLSSYLEALWKIDPQRCANEGGTYLHEMPRSTEGFDYAAWVAYCAESLDEKPRREILLKLAKYLEPSVDKPPPGLSDDDHSSLIGTLVEIYDWLGDKNQGDLLTAKRLTLLEKAAQAATSFEQRATFQDHRLACYMRLKKYDAAEKMLRDAERQRPEDFNTPWRLANFYLKQEKYDQGLQAINRSLARGYGSRRIRLYTTKIDLLLKKGDFESARQVVDKARQELSTFNENQVRSYLIEGIETRAKQIDDATKVKKKG